MKRVHLNTHLHERWEQNFTKVVRSEQHVILPSAQQIAYFAIPGNEHKPCFVLIHGHHYSFIVVTEGQYLVESNHPPCFASSGASKDGSIQLGQWRTKSFAINNTYPPPGGPVPWAKAITLTRAQEMEYIFTHCQKFAGSPSDPATPWVPPDTFYQFRPLHCIDFAA